MPFPVNGKANHNTNIVFFDKIPRNGDFFIVSSTFGVVLVPPHFLLSNKKINLHNLYKLVYLLWR